MLKLFLTQMDRTILDSFSHANIGPRETKAGRLLLEAEKELENAVPNLSFKYDEDITPDWAVVLTPFAGWFLEISPREQRISRISKSVSFLMCWISWLVTWMQGSNLR